MNTAATDVLILAGGLGTRLQEVVSDRPKPMADIDGRPFLSMLTNHVAAFGFKRFLLGIGHMAESVEKEFINADLPYEVEFVREDSPLGTGGAVANACGALRSEAVMVMNGDSFCPVDLKAMLDYHTSRQAEITAALVEVDDISDYGSVAVDKASMITAFLEKNSSGGAGFVNAGIYIFQKQIIEDMDTHTPFSLEKDFFPAMTNRCFCGFPVRAELLDIGTPERYQRAREVLHALMKTASDRS